MDKRLGMVLGMAVLVLAQAGADAATYRAGKTSGAIEVDGKLDEAAWLATEASSHFHHLKERAEGGAPPPTSFRIMADDAAVYIGVHCAEPNMAELRAEPLFRDGPVFSRDAIEMFIDPEGEGVNYYQLVVSAANDQWDAYYIEGGNTQGGDYSAFWESAVHKGDDFWSLETRIPLSAFFYTDSTAFSSTWRINVSRQRKPVYQLLTWSRLRLGFHEPTSFGRVVKMPGKPSRFDVRVSELNVSLCGQTAQGYVGGLTVQTTATSAAAGDYTFSAWADGHGLVEARRVTVASGQSSFMVEDVVLPRLGKALMKAALHSMDGELRNGVFSSVRLEYAPLSIDVREPFYAQCIFPGQRVETIAGSVTVNLREELLGDAVLSAELSGPGTAEGVARCPVRGRVADFAFDATGLREGEHTLTCVVQSGAEVLARGQAVIRKLPRPASNSYVYVDRNLNLVVNDRPLFVRGFYGGGSHGMGAPLWQDRAHPTCPYFNAFRCQVGMEAERIDSGERDNCKHDREPSQRVFDTMKQRIEANRGNTDFWWYYLADEPECRGLSPVYLRHQYRFIKAHDPYHPVIVITRAPERYTECADILNPHPYLGPRVAADGTRSMRSVKMIREQMQTVLSAGKGRIPPWLTPQAFSYGFIDSQADSPTFLEFRCMVYAAICNGCKGLTPFAYSPHFQSMDLRLGVPFIYETLFCLDRFLLDASPPIPVRVDAPDDGVDVWLKRVDDEVVLIAVNLLGRPLSATLTSPGIRGLGTLFGFRDPKFSVVRDESVHLKFAPYQVWILTNPRMLAVNGAGAKLVSTLLSEIETAEDALKKRGNILFGRGREIEWDASHTYIRPKSLYTLTNGVTDCLGFKVIGHPQTPAWVTMGFDRFRPEFRRMRIYTGTVADLDVQTWQDGGWVTIGTVRDNTAPVVELTFGRKVRPAKLRVMMTKLHQAGMRSSGGWGGGSAELYEIELYE